MSRLLPLLAVATLAAAFVSVVFAGEDVPWKTGQPQDTTTPNPNPTDSSPAGTAPTPTDATQPAAQDQGPVDLKTALAPDIYQRAILPIIVQTKQAENVLALYDKEMAKEPSDRNEKRALGYRLSAARFYMAASQKARQGKDFIKDADLQSAVTTQYEVPTRDKAVAIYLALADEAMGKNDVQTAVEYYQMAIKADPENAVAKEQLVKLADMAKKQAGEGPSGRTGSSGGKDETDQDSIYRPTHDYQDKQDHDEYTPADYNQRYDRTGRYTP